MHTVLQFSQSRIGSGAIKDKSFLFFFMKTNALWPATFLNAAILPWTLGEMHSTPSYRSANNGDICERCFPRINVLKNVFPPSFTFHITSAANDALTADRAGTTERVALRIHLCSWDRLDRKVQRLGHDPAHIRCSWLQLLKVRAKKVQPSGANSVRYLILYSSLISVKVDHNPQTQSLQTTVQFNLSGVLTFCTAQCQLWCKSTKPGW